MSTVIQFPVKSFGPALFDEDADQLNAMRAMLRYLHREACETGLGGTAAHISQALASLDAERPA